MLRSRLAVLAALSLMSCNEADGSHETHLRAAPVVPSAGAPKVIEEAGPHPADIREDPEKIAETLKVKKAMDEEDWKPKEYGDGASRWKDTGVYVDGKPLGFLAYGQLPIGCKLSWMRGKVSAEKRAGTNDPGWKWARQRYYKFTDYLKAIGVDLHKVKEMHIYGPKITETLILSGRDLLSPAANEVYFTFGSITRGKPLPHSPEGLGTGRLGDKISGVMVYIDKKPPKLVDNEGMFLDGEEQTGVPYYGEPVRGGVRIYLDDKLAAIIKRQDLDPKQATKGPDGEPRWSLAGFLTAHGVDTKTVVEGWSIQDESRDQKFSKDELATLTFEASSRSKGGVLLGDKQVLANAIALHSRALKPADMPLPEQDDE
jgi:hypothetical protein